jgi:hypothetical protein
VATSWYVEVLLRNRLQIRENILEKENTLTEQIVTADLDDEDYNNLLIVEKTLQDLLNNRQLSAKEIIIINMLLQYKSLSQIEKETGYTRMWIVKIIEDVCDRIAFILGDEFTNEGYLSRLAEKNHLTEAQIETARVYMNSNRRNFPPRRKKN